MLLHLLQASCVIEPSPADEVEATACLTTELLRALHVGNLLEELVLRVEVREFQVGQFGAVAHLVDPVDGLLCGAADLVLALGSAEQHVGVAHQAQVDTVVQTGHHLVIQAGAEVSELGHRQTTVTVVGHHKVVGRHRRGVAHVAILKAVPVVLVGADGPVEARVERAVGGALLLEEVVEPGRCREVSPSAVVAGAEVTLDGRALRGVGTGVDGCPLVVGTLSAVVEELHLEEALGIILILRALAEVVAIVLHQFILAILAADDVLQIGECVAVLVAHHQGAGQEAGGGTLVGAAVLPLTAQILGGQQVEGLLEVALHLIHHAVVLQVGVFALGLIVRGIESVE